MMYLESAIVRRSGQAQRRSTVWPTAARDGCAAQLSCRDAQSWMVGRLPEIKRLFNSATAQALVRTAARRRRDRQLD
eukprot:354988-Chlamydomonas_euryale.AAC.10